MDNDSLEAVYDDDIEELLESLGELDKFNNGETYCKYCGDMMSKDNLAAIFPEKDDVGFCCDKPECIALLFEEDNSK